MTAGSTADGSSEARSADDGSAPEGGPAPPTGWLARLDLVGTVAFVAVTAAVAVVDGDDIALANLVVSAALFLVGSLVWGAGFVLAAGRSRTHVIDLAGLFYLTGSAPRSVRRFFLGLWFVQIAVAVAAIVVTSPPFGVMAPVFGIGVITLWAATRGTFPEREPAPGSRVRRSGPQ